DSNQQRGECVVLVGGWTAPEGEQAISTEAQRVLDLLLAELPLKRAAALAAEITGVRKNLLYQLALEKQKTELWQFDIIAGIGCSCARVPVTL
ncbi:hypothetical protein ABFV62_28355, partial [Pseudomonas syringae]